ncbi:MAG: prolipoprotein diacylglyceryl transferase [Rhodobacteraceae bacterium]|jgi:phosphatidylglycerol:prolipoprotein diacylglycerol transferase|uniref:prolipoprotein diacylglyceryl transferase n=1 Tax=Albidovulum sp. TaxID=1872424 RepID=UPI001DBAB04E|nr:prolipoprotein diacylglyceryl transferase [uncultured Defluviimonas sp.]MCB2126305.1 prolipoprotein diacylglyceryl transferase [Paracoccaceae bacterium]MCC0069773.1 prolipoprotein diacylglyceryl transferase [Paracoccaceae bacterium]
MQAAIPFPDISSEVFSIELFGAHLALRWYALAYLAGLFGGLLVIRRLLRRPALWPGNVAPMAPERADDLLTAIILGVILGGRLGFVLFYQPLYYLAHPLEIVKVWEGGMSFHGGFLGVLVAGLWFARRNGVPAMQLSDAMALVAPIGLFFGRIANFVNAELWGRPTDLPWGVIFPGLDAQDCPGIIPGLCARHPSQLYEAGLEGLALGLLLWLLVRRGALKRPGIVTGVFLMGYGAARFAVEFVRQADAQFITPDNPLGHALQVGGFGLSMGQILSLPMILAGLWFIGKARRA